MPTIHHKKKNYLFYHIPKTAGTSISTMIREDGGCPFMYGHKPLKDVLLEIDPEFIFTIRRDPLSRALSMWNYFATGAIVEECCFDRFLELLPDVIKNYKDGWLLSPQKWFLGEIDVHEVMFESIETELPPVMDRIGLRGPISHLNKKAYPPHEWTQEQVDRVREIYAEDFD